MAVQLRAGPGRMSLVGEIVSPHGRRRGKISMLGDVAASPSGRMSRLARLFFPCELSHGVAARNASADAVCDLIDVGSLNSAGQIRIYDAGRVTRLAAIFVPNPAFGAAVNGICSGLSLPWSDADADNSGTAAAFDFLDRDENIILQGDVALAGAELNFNQLVIEPNDVVKILNAQYTAAP